MTQNEKDILLKDLSARLPYGVKLQHIKNTDSIVELYSMDLDDFYHKIQFYTYKGKVLTASEEGKLLKPGGMLRYKPCLFPLSSMTKQQEEELIKLINTGQNDNNEFMRSLCRIEFYHKNHFDYHGLIPMGLANDATGLNIY